MGREKAVGALVDDVVDEKIVLDGINYDDVLELRNGSRESIKGNKYIEEHLDEVGDFYEGIFDEQRLVNAEYEDYLDDLVKLDKEILDDIEVIRNKYTESGVSSTYQRGSTSVQHAVESANQAQSVLDGINPKYFNPESRFGGGFYVGADADTIVAELAEHGNTAKYAISYDMNLSGQKVLDLTNPQIASEWGYVQNLTSTKACQNIGEIARTKGYNVIKFQSYRGDGINYVIYNDFENILLPRNVTPID